MIINLKGSNGAGKSHLVRQIMKTYSRQIEMQYPPGRGRKRQPIGYLLQNGEKQKPLFVPGHYRIANGGLDTIQDLNVAYALILEHHNLGANVLYEGMNMSDGSTRILRLKFLVPDTRVILINPPLKTCVDSVKMRGHKISEKTIERLYHKGMRDIEKLKSGGVSCLVLSRQKALEQLTAWLTVDQS